MNGVLRWLSLLGLLLLTGCHRPDMPNDDFVGIWVATKKSVLLFPPVPGESLLKLQEGGTCTLQKFPGWTDLRGPLSLVSGNGRWQLTARDGEQVVELEYRNSAMPERGTWTEYLHISGHGLGLRLYVILDYDAWTLYEYQKR